MNLQNQISEAIAGYGLREAEIKQIIDGSNSVVAEVYLNQPSFAIKIYKGSKERRDRSLAHEVEALQILNVESRILAPKLIAYSFNPQSILYEWVSGGPISDLFAAKGQIRNAIKALNEMYIENKTSVRAVDGVVKIEDLTNQLAVRNAQVCKIANIPKRFLKELQVLNNRVNETLNRNCFRYDLTLSFSDFGPHNLIQSDTGKFYFIDFEFFGVDSYAKLFSDLISHPKGIFDSFEILAMIRELKISESFTHTGFLAAIALKWAYISLRRSTDSVENRFIGFNTNYENPFNYLNYCEYLLNLRNAEQLKTYLEFRSMR